MSTIEDVQVKLDDLMLAVFEAARSSDLDLEASLTNVRSKYASTTAAVDELEGLDMSEQEQIETIRELNQQYEEVRQRVLKMRTAVELLEGETSKEVERRLAAANLERKEEQA